MSSEDARRAAEYIASHLNNPGDIREGVTVGDCEGVTFAAASPTGEAVTVIVIAAAYAVRSEDDPLDQKFFPYP